MTSPVPRRVVLLTHPAQRMLTGIARYATADRRLVFELAEPSLAMAEQLAADPPAGVIAYVGPGLIEPLRALPCPVINHSGQLDRSPFPRVMVDDEAAGRLAAQHLLGRGFQRLAVVHFETAAFSVRRLRGFKETCEAAGREAIAWSLGAVPGWDVRHRSRPADEAIAQWLTGLAFPLGLFCVNDRIAWRVAMICYEQGIDVPEQVSILGMDNVPGICDLCHPTLSSVIGPWEEVGFKSAALLDQLMAGEQPPEEDILVPSPGIVTRRSTSVLAIEDPQIARCLRFIRHNAHTGISVMDVAKHAGLARRTMEDRFRRLLGRTPLEEINRVKVELAKELLLADRTLPLETVAFRAGYESLQWLHRKFHEYTGTTPAKWRKR